MLRPSDHYCKYQRLQINDKNTSELSKSLHFTISPPSEAHLTGVISVFEDLLDSLLYLRHRRTATHNLQISQ